MKRFIVILAALFSISVSDSIAQVPDNTFGTNGIVVTPGPAEINAIATQADGKIVTAGFVYINAQFHIQVCRYNSNGSLDNSFGTNGKVTTEISFASMAKAIAVQPNGKIVIAGTYYTGDFVNIYHGLLIRYKTDGTLDKDFGVEGIVMEEIDFSESFEDMKLLADGKIVTGGSVAPLTQIATEQFMLAKYNSDGSRDNTFGFGGVARLTAGLHSGIASIVIQPDGKIVAGGFEGIGGINTSMDSVKFALARFDIQGNPDNTFGNFGVVLTNVNENTPDAISTVRLQPDGKILAGGCFGGNQFIVRYLADGTMDNSFGTNGKAIRVGFQSMQFVLTGNDKIVSVSSVLFDTENMADFLLSGYLQHGATDNNFGLNGALSTNIGAAPQSSSDYARCLTIQADGKIIAAGTSEGNAALVRYTMDGSTGTEEVVFDDRDLAFYPNPFEHTINLDFKGMQTEKTALLRISNIAGQSVFNATLHMKQGKNKMVLPNLAPGNYILTIGTATGKTWSKKITRK